MILRGYDSLTLLTSNGSVIVLSLRLRVGILIRMRRVPVPHFIVAVDISPYLIASECAVRSSSRSRRSGSAMFFPVLLRF